MSSSCRVVFIFFKIQSSSQFLNSRDLNFNAQYNGLISFKVNILIMPIKLKYDQFNSKN